MQSPASSQTAPASNSSPRHSSRSVAGSVFARSAGERQHVADRLRHAAQAIGGAALGDVVDLREDDDRPAHVVADRGPA